VIQAVYARCTLHRSQVGPDDPLCVKSGQQPLPPGGYHTRTLIAGLPMGSYAVAQTSLTVTKQ
jgi:hypothetical protein